MVEVGVGVEVEVVWLKGVKDVKEGKDILTL